MTESALSEASIRARLDAQARPPGSLGRIEDLAVELALIQERATPRADRIALLLFAGDHGLTQDGVSAYPAEVTQAMVATFLGGRATANAFARAVGVQTTVIDAGVAADLSHPDLVDAKVGRGTRNAARTRHDRRRDDPGPGARRGRPRPPWRVAPTCWLWARWASATPPRRRC